MAYDLGTVKGRRSQTLSLPAVGVFGGSRGYTPFRIHKRLKSFSVSCSLLRIVPRVMYAEFIPLCPCFAIFPNLARRAFEPFLTVAFAVCFGVPPLFPDPPRPLLYFLPIVYAAAVAVLIAL